MKALLLVHWNLQSVTKKVKVWTSSPSTVTRTTNRRKNLQQTKKIQNKKVRMYGMVARKLIHVKHDPAAQTYFEALLTHPGVKALAAHRLSHFLWSMALNFCLYAQSVALLTQIEIHPGARDIHRIALRHHGPPVIGEHSTQKWLSHHGWLLGTGKDCGNAILAVRKERLYRLMPVIDRWNGEMPKLSSERSCCGRCSLVMWQCCRNSSAKIVQSMDRWADYPRV